MVACKLCDWNYKFLSSHIIKFHHRTISQYKQEFGEDTPLVDEKAKKEISDKVKEIRSTGFYDQFNKQHSEFMKEKWQDEEYKQKHSEGMQKLFKTEKYQEYKNRLSVKLSEIKKAEWANPEHTYNTKEYIENVSNGRKEQWKNPEMARKWMESNHAKPNEKELKLNRILQEQFPALFSFNGDARLNIVIDGKIPDFVNTNDQQVIELFGNYWHGEIKTGKTKEENEIAIIYHYSRFKIKCLVVWEKELDYEQILIEKIRSFVCQK